MRRCSCGCGLPVPRTRAKYRNRDHEVHHRRATGGYQRAGSVGGVKGGITKQRQACARLAAQLGIVVNGTAWAIYDRGRTNGYTSGYSRGKRVGYAEGWSAAIGERRTA